MKIILCLPWKHSPEREMVRENWEMNDIDGNKIGYIIKYDDSHYYYRGSAKGSSINGYAKTAARAKAIIEQSVKIKIVNDRLKNLL